MRAGCGHYILMNCIDEKLRQDVGMDETHNAVVRGTERALILLIASMLEISGGKLNESNPLSFLMYSCLLCTLSLSPSLSLSHVISFSVAFSLLGGRVGFPGHSSLFWKLEKDDRSACQEQVVPLVVHTYNGIFLLIVSTNTDICTVRKRQERATHRRTCWCYITISLERGPTPSSLSMSSGDS